MTRSSPGARGLAELIGRSSRLMAFTGAGISTGSGIPDFRGPGGVWSRRRPVYYQEFLESEESRIEHWDYKLEGYEAFRQASPNPAHMALVELERAGRLEALVTQNIDGLHRKAGHSEERIIELHGTNSLVECLSCGRQDDPAAAFEEFRRTRRPPRCACGGLLKTATVMFGQLMPMDKVERAIQAARACDLVLAVGTTLEVMPAAAVPLARRAGVPYAIVNRGATAHDGQADLKLEEDAAAVLPEAVALALGRGSCSA